MQEYKHKEDVIATRVGALGGSDAAIIHRVTMLHGVPRSAYKRLAVVKGLIMQAEKPATRAMAYGDYIENAIFEHLAENNADYQSNPLLVGERLSRPNVKLLCHPDILRVDKEKKTVYVYEVKTSGKSTATVKNAYRAQMYVEWLLAKEYAMRLGKEYKVQLFLVHYDTTDVDLSEPFTFEPERIKIVRIFSNRDVKVFDVGYGMDLIDEFLDTYEEYREDEEIDSRYLPMNVRQKFHAMTEMLAEIKEREQKVAEFREHLCQYMTDKGIKSIKNDCWAISLIPASESVSFDYKKYLEELAASHPRKAARIRMEYSKVTKKKASVSIRLKNKE